MTIKQNYESIKKTCDEIYQLSTSQETIESTLLRSNHLLSDLNAWIRVLKNRPEYKILENAIKELELSIITLNFGFYSKSYAGLRFFLERSLVAILFSSQELEFRLWEKGGRDTSWSEITDENNGIFSEKFSRAFFPELKDEIKHFRTMTKKVYRECSEYVHGNNSIIQAMPSHLEFSKTIFESWHDKFETVSRIVLFTLNLRYAKHLPNDVLNTLEDVNSDHFNSIKPIQELYYHD